MTEWKEYKIDDLCDTISDTYKGKDSNVILINTSDVLEGKILNHETVPNEKLKGQFKKTFKTDDILYSEIRPRNKRFAYVDIEDTSLYIASTKLMVLRPNTEIIEPRFLFAILSSQCMIDELQLRAESRSGTFPQITFSAELAPMTVQIPNRKTQEKIVSLIDSFNGKIENNNHINRNLSEQAQALYKYWFVDCDWNECVVPSIWKEVTIEELTSLVTRGITPKYHDESDQIVINQKCIRNHMINLELARTHTPKSINEKWIQFGDVLINSTGEGTLGRAAQVMFTPTNMTVDTHVTIVRPMSRKLIYYIGQWVIANEREIEAQHTGSTGQTELPRDRVKSMKLRRPDDKILMRFNECIGPMMEQIIKNQEENARLAEMRDILLPRLMSGKLDVSALVL